MEPIIEDYVSFEIAKLLKEKGFDEMCHCIYQKNGSEIQWFGSPDVNYTYMEKAGGNVKEEYLRPSTALVIKWLRVKHNIHIQHRVGFGQPLWYDYLIQWDDGNGYYTGKNNENYSSPEEATEAAILYSLKELIK